MFRPQNLDSPLIDVQIFVPVQTSEAMRATVFTADRNV